MKSKFGILSKLYFLQNIVSSFISKINPAIIHNIEKYMAIKKAHYLSIIEDLEGDYLEFGVFNGSSFSHSIRCFKALNYLNPNKNVSFYGFDSFEGFGKLEDEDKHSFYTDQNFEVDYKSVLNRVKKYQKGEINHKINLSMKLSNEKDFLKFWKEKNLSNTDVIKTLTSVASVSNNLSWLLGFIKHN